MKYAAYCIVLFILVSCQQNKSIFANRDQISNDSLTLAKMIREREKAMINKDIKTAMSQFSDDITWINSQGYYFEGKDEVLKFHSMLAGNDSLDYYYEAGTPRIRILNSSNAIAYYSWKMFWYKKQNKADTTFREIGLMTLNAQKQNEGWKWVAITNQHTPWFYAKIEPVQID